MNYNWRIVNLQTKSVTKVKCEPNFLWIVAGGDHDSNGGGFEFGTKHGQGTHTVHHVVQHIAPAKSQILAHSIM